MIQDSRNYIFIIRNCTVISAGSLNSDAGIKLYNVNNGTIISNNCSFNNYHGIFASLGLNNTITQNILTNNKIYGIHLLLCKNYTISKNNFSGSGLYLECNFDDINSLKIENNNSINGKSIYYYVNQTNLNSNDFLNAGQIFLINCNNSIIDNQDFTSGTEGILLHSCRNTTISDITISNQTRYGIELINSNYNNLSNIYFLNNTEGISLDDNSSNNLIRNNTISECIYGIHISYNSNYNNLTFNKLYNINTGFDLYSNKNTTIENNTLFFGNYGIYLRASNDNKILSNNFTEFSEDGIYVYQCNRNKIIRNRLYNSSIIIGGGSKNDTLYRNEFNNLGLEFSFSGSIVGGDNSHSIDTTNLVNNRPLYYYTNIENLRIENFTNAGQIILINCNNSIISNQKISSTINGITLFLCFNNTIFNNTISTNQDYGIFLRGCYNNSVNNNYLFDNNIGIEFEYGTNNSIKNNHIYDNIEYGIFLYSEHNNTLIDNTIYNNYIDGIFIWGCSWIDILGNELFSNDYGIYLKLSKNNTIENNNINYNIIGVFFESSNFTYVINNILVDNFACFNDDGNCHGNIFINNRCIKTIFVQEEDDDSEKEEEKPNLTIFLIVGIGSIAILSGLSCFYIVKKLRFPRIKVPKGYKIIKSSKEILAGYDKKELLEIFQEGGIPDTLSFLKELDLTIISKVLAKKVDKLHLEEKEKVEFLKEIFYFPSEERDAFVDDLLKELKLSKKRKSKIDSWEGN